MLTSLHLPIVLLALLSPCSLSLSLFSHHQVPGDEPPMIIQKREPINQQHRNQQCRDRKKSPQLTQLGFSLSSAHSQSNLYSSTKKKKEKEKNGFLAHALHCYLYGCIFHCIMNVSRASVYRPLVLLTATCGHKHTIVVEMCIKTALWWIKMLATTVSCRSVGLCVCVCVCEVEGRRKAREGQS